MRALKESKGTMFVEQERSANLTAKIQTTLRSTKLQQGLNGKILMDGQYLQKADMDKLSLYKKFSNDGANLFKQKQWEVASEKLQKAIDLAQDNPFISNDALPELTSKQQIATVQTFIEDVGGKLKQKSWESAIQSCSDALAYLRELPPEVQQQYAEQLQKQLAKSQFGNLKQKADALFAESDWQQSTSAYQQALTTGKGSKGVPREALEEITLNIERAKLYQAINRGNLSFSAGSWNEAIDAYKNAQTLLASNKNIFIDIDGGQKHQKNLRNSFSRPLSTSPSRQRRNTLRRKTSRQPKPAMKG